MRHSSTSTFKTMPVMVAVIFLTASTANVLHAREWQAWLGAQSRDLGSQALAFLPNELWIHANDSIRWTLTSTEIHTVTFLIPPPPPLPGQPPPLGQVRNPLFGQTFGVQVGCPGVTPDGSTFDGSNCVNSGVMGTFDAIVGPKSYSVRFPK